MKKAYIYPNSNKKEATNPYLNDFINALSQNFEFINKYSPSKSGIIDLFKYLDKTDIVFLHWIEDLPDKKGGYLQGILFIILVFLIKIKKIKIFYTLHNKESHYPTNKAFKKVIRKVIHQNADYIIFHSSEGLKLTHQIKTTNIKYIPHPLKNLSSPEAPTKKEFDIIIWGSIRRYKGIDKFLSFLEERNLLHKYSILIVGSIYPSEYEQYLMKFNSEKIRIQNIFVNDNDLNILIAKSSIVLFTYNESSVLSSGALVYSISQGASVIGPKTGAFLDLHNEGIIGTFNNYEDLLTEIDQHLTNPAKYLNKIPKYIAENTWPLFGEKITKWIGL
jgi:hypothetical protein